MTQSRFTTRSYDEYRANQREEFAALSLLIQFELKVGDRVQEIYADTWGTVTGFEGRDGVLVDWDDPQPEDNECGPIGRHELIKPTDPHLVKPRP